MTCEAVVTGETVVTDEAVVTGETVVTCDSYTDYHDGYINVAI